MAKKKESAAPAESHGSAIHLPPPSYWPIVLAFGMLVLGIGIVFSKELALIPAAVGIVIMLAALVGWTGENRALEAQEEHGHHE